MNWFHFLIITGSMTAILALFLFDEHPKVTLALFIFSALCLAIAGGLS